VLDLRIAEGIEALEVNVDFAGRQSTIHPVLIWDNETVILVDTGFPGTEQKLKEAAEGEGVPFDRVDKIIITHQDIDHIGGLPAIIAKAKGKIVVFAHEIEKPYIEGEKPLIKFNPVRLAKMLEGMPEERRSRLGSLLSNPPKSKVDVALQDGQKLPYCGGITVIHTPGHTPGHISLYHVQSKTLIAGDALIADRGHLSGPNPASAFDIDEANRSVEKFKQFDIENVICYHGGVCRDNIRNRIAELAK